MSVVKLDHRSIRYWRRVNGRVDHEARNRYAAALAVGLAILVCAALAASAIASI